MLNLLKPAQFFVARHIENQVFAAPVIISPFPYMIVDNVFPRRLLNKIREHWPGSSNFIPEGQVPGNYVDVLAKLHASADDRADFWQGFARMAAPVLARASLAQFAPWILIRYGQDLARIEVGSTLMQADSAFQGHDCHAHHYHDPCWVVTILFYVDDDPGGHNGTTINSARPPEDENVINYLSLEAAQKVMTETAPIDYKPNRMTAFLDSVMSYHSVKPTRSKPHGRRRIIRIHLGAPKSYCEIFYGVSWPEYRKRRMAPHDNPEVLQWIRRDILELKSTEPTMTLRERRKWASSLEIAF